MALITRNSKIFSGLILKTKILFHLINVLHATTSNELFNRVPGVKYSSFYQETLANSPVHCSAGCRLLNGCLLVSYNRHTHQCRLSDVQQYDLAGNPLGELQSSSDWTTYMNGKDDCTPSSCLNGGTCTDAIGSFKCACPTGYMGHRCDVDIDHCASNPCLNGGVCFDGLLSYTCQCPSSYNVGSRCQCPATWELVQSTCFRVYTYTEHGLVAYIGYSSAGQHCASFGSAAHLGSVKNESDLNNLKAFTQSSSTFPVFLSAQYKSNNGVFEWHDGSPVDFNWALGEPGITDACMAYMSPLSYGFIGESCLNIHKFLCQKDI